MSFLIRKGNGGGPPRPPAARLSGGMTNTQRRSSIHGSTPGGPAAKNSSIRVSASGLSRGGGVQLQQHRRLQPQKQQYEAQKEMQGVISMDEVMADLEVLAQQQRDSQRKLELTKLSKQQKLEQRLTLENKLADLKYTNGQKHAQLLRARDVLSRGTRELGAARLQAGRAGDDLKAFDQRLKRAFLCNRRLQVARRKVDSGFLSLRSKLSIASRLKAEAMDKVRVAQQERDDAQRQEDSLRRSTQENLRRVSQLVEETTSTRSDIAGLEQDLAGAKQSEASAKLRADGAKADMQAEDKCHKEAMASKLAQLKELQKQHDELVAQNQAKQAQFDGKKVKLAEVWKRYVTYQQGEGVDVSPEPQQDGSPLPMLDLESKRSELEARKTAFQEEKSKYEQLRVTVDEQRNELNRLESETIAAVHDADKTRASATTAQDIESKRQEASKAILSSFQQEMDGVVKLRLEVKELQKAQDRQKQCADEQGARHTREVEDIQRDIREATVRVASEQLAVSTLEQTMEQDGVENVNRIEAARLATEDARVAVEEGRSDVVALRSRLESDMYSELEHIKHSHAMMLEDPQEAVAQLLTDYPELEDLEIVYDPALTAEEQARTVLADIQEGCEKRIKEARKRRDRGLEQETSLAENEGASRKRKMIQHDLAQPKRRGEGERKTSRDPSDEKKRVAGKRATSELSQIMRTDDEEKLDEDPFWDDKEPLTQTTQSSHKSVRWKEESPVKFRTDSRSKTYGHRDREMKSSDSSSKSRRKDIPSILKVNDRSHHLDGGSSSLKRSSSSSSSSISKRLKTDKSSQSRSSSSGEKHTKSKSRDSGAPSSFEKRTTEKSNSSGSTRRKPDSKRNQPKDGCSESNRIYSAKSVLENDPSSSSRKDKLFTKKGSSGNGEKASSSGLNTDVDRGSAKSSRSGMQKSNNLNSGTLAPKSSKHVSGVRSKKSQSSALTSKVSRQASGISSMEKGSKTFQMTSRSRRRKKKDGQVVSKPKDSFGLDMIDDFDFHF